ncbi:MAG: chemotaxis protein CheY [Bacteroidetes bacterium]|nr:chemotaxis protein CheY [Bacteroidota bacterium]
MLIDDDEDDNFYHEREILRNNADNTVLIKDSGRKALDYISSDEKPHSDLIFLDVNMPKMNGWEFLQEYNLLDKDVQSHAIIIMLSTSDYSADIAKSKTWDFVSDFITKPLTHQKMKEIREKYFPE